MFIIAALLEDLAASVASPERLDGAAREAWRGAAKNRVLSRALACSRVHGGMVDMRAAQRCIRCA